MDLRRSAYSRRLEKVSQRDKRLGAFAVLGVAVGVAGVLAPPLNIDWSGLGSKRDEITHYGVAAAASMAASMPAAAAERSPARRIYPFSIIPGGVADGAELARVIKADRVVAAHYAGFDVGNARAVTVTAPRAVYVSYRKGDQVFWTKKKLMLAQGETLLTDGENEMRARCANRISDLPMLPVEAHGPTESELDSFVAEGVVEDASLLAVAADLDGLDLGLESGESYRTVSFPNGAGLVLPAGLRQAERLALLASPSGRNNAPMSYGGRLGDGEQVGANSGGPSPTTPVDTPILNTPTPPVPAPDTPGRPGEPETPSQPGKPGQPGQPETPGQPEMPGQPETPGLPGTPGQPETPGLPETPGVPEIPVDPADPVEVPEPGTVWLAGLAFGCMAWLRRKGAARR